MTDSREEEEIVVIPEEPEEEEGEEEEEKRGGCLRIIVIITIIILLLLLFWPVAPKRKRPSKPTARTLPQVKAAGVVGQTRYRIKTAQPVKEINKVKYGSYKASLIGVSFMVKNLSNKDKVLDYYMVKISDQYGNKFEINPKLTEIWYQANHKRSPWGRRVKANGEVEAHALFYVYKSPAKSYNLVAKDFDWQSNKSIDLNIGVFDTLIKN